MGRSDGSGKQESYVDLNSDDTSPFKALGKVGRIVHLYADGDVKVQVTGGCWIFNPLAVTKVSQTLTAEDSNDGT